MELDKREISDAKISHFFSIKTPKQVTVSRNSLTNRNAIFKPVPLLHLL